MEVYYTCNVTSLMDNFWIADVIAIMLVSCCHVKKKERNWIRDQRCDTGHWAWFFAFKHCYISLYIICDNIGGYLKTTLIKEYLLSNQVIEEPVKKWQNVGGANTLVKISFHK